MIDTPVLSSISEATFLDLALYYGPFIIFYSTANASSLLILFKYARVETTCHFLTLFSEIGVFRVFDRDFPFGIGSSVRYFTILAGSELPRPIKILICRIGQGGPNDFDIITETSPYERDPRFPPNI